jgi:phosphopantothenoylcysteine synthetase/decarboxylase
MFSGQRILLIVSGGIAAYKSLELIRRLREGGATVRCILTRAGAEFVTPLSLAALSGDKVYDDLFSLTDEAEMGHIELSRDADLLVVAPAEGEMACGEFGFGRLAEPEEIAAAIADFFRSNNRLRGTRALVTSGPTYEAIDPVRYIANRSSGRQGHAIADALSRLGAAIRLASGSCASNRRRT